MKNWFIDKALDEVYDATSAHEKAELFQNILLKKLDEIFPEKVRKVNSDNQSWISFKLKQMDRKRKRIYHKERRSEKWKLLNKAFKKEMKSAKTQFYKNKVAELKLAKHKHGQWYQ
jgi:hypothetical protein